MLMLNGFSFPGGNVDKRDKNVVDTALRETFEEIGIHPRYFHVWGVMQPTINKVITGLLPLWSDV